MHRATLFFFTLYLNYKEGPRNESGTLTYKIFQPKYDFTYDDLLENGFIADIFMVLHLLRKLMAWAYYESGTNYSGAIPLNTMITSIAGAFGGIAGPPGESGQIFNRVNNGLTVMGCGNSGSSTIPGAYLQYMVFDKSYQFLYGGFQRVTAAGNMAQEKIVQPQILIDEPGYIFIFLYNRSDSPKWVYFDDLKVTHQHSLIVAGADYYPFGLPIESRKITQEDYRWGYQGQFSEGDDETKWNAFDLRMYDARFGRWNGPDPQRQFFSPYIGMGNNPSNFFDPNGGWIIFANKAQALRIAADINRVFRAKYDLDYDVITVGDYKIKGQDAPGGKFETNSDFAWNIDEHAAALFDVINVEHAVYAEIVTGVKIIDPSLLGKTFNSSSFVVHDQVPNFPNDFGISIGMVAIHESTYHMHQLYAEWIQTTYPEQLSNVGYYHYSNKENFPLNPIRGNYAGKLYKSMSGHDALPYNFIGKIVNTIATLDKMRAATGGVKKIVRTPRYRH